MSRCGECKLGCNEEGALYCEENLGYEQCIDKLQDALYTADRPQKVIAQNRVQIIRKEIERLCENCERPTEEETKERALESMVFGFSVGLTADRPSGENCEFCRCHEKEDVLYELVDWDYGLAFDEIRNIKYCPLCGATLKGADDE